MIYNVEYSCNHTVSKDLPYMTKAKLKEKLEYYKYYCLCPKCMEELHTSKK